LHSTSDPWHATRTVPLAPPSTVVFAPGETAKTLTITVLPDTVPELPEAFIVGLFAPMNAFVADPIGVGIIVDPMPPPGPTAASSRPPLP